MANSSSWESKWRHRLSVSICGERANHPRKRGERSSRITRRRWLRWTSSRWATFRVLFVFLVLSHDRRRILHWNITEHPTEEWTVQQLREAFPWDEAPRYLIRDRDAIFGRETGATIKGMGTEAVVT